MQSHPSKDIVGSKGRELRDKRIALCVTGSIAAIEAPKLARELMRHGAEVFPVMSPSAQKMIHPDVMEWATGNQVITEMNGKVEFLSIAMRSHLKTDLVLVAPATANTIGKIALGINDSPVTAVVLAAHGSGIPIMLAPAMHQCLYDYPATVENIRRLTNIGFSFISPIIAEEKAKLAEVGVILEAVIRKFTKQDMATLRLLLVAGPTYEYIDPVRIITNRSSGKMGVALARNALRRGAIVTLIYGSGQVDPPKDAEVIRVGTSEEMLKAVLSELDKSNYDLMMFPSAVADYTPILPSSQKFSTSIMPELTLKLKATRKIIDDAKKASPKTFTVGFKVEYKLSDEDLVERAFNKLKKSGIDLIVSNDISREGVGFQYDTNEVLIVDNNKKVAKTPLMRKDAVAEKILDYVLEKLKSSKY